MENDIIYQIVDSISKSVVSEDVETSHYIQFWHHICRMMTNWGVMFGFVVEDVMKKVEKLEEMRKNNEETYRTLRNMVQFEEKTKIIRRPKPNRSGTSLVRVLNCALKFLITFLEQVRNERNPEEYVGQFAKLAYNQHLAPLHSWAVRTVVSGALFTLPKHQEFMRRLRGSSPVENDELFFETVIGKGNDIVRIVCELETKHGILEHNPSS
ncbi:unnamed protein product [Caenorhabditis angaria]|uniref:Glycolipid transfer protein domain-containing protein n=1 Tax=Caenorhabditis angaria TaxID=860376 RepID=A0A9P1IL50_9PELO|nr:unnamed protein product [Caenorhabditis angaria]